MEIRDLDAHFLKCAIRSTMANFRVVLYSVLVGKTTFSKRRATPSVLQAFCD